MRDLIIIGAGGMGRTVYDNAKECIGYGDTFRIKGFIDDNLHVLDDFENYPKILGTISDYVPQKNDVFVSSIGGSSRRKCMEEIIKRGGEFFEIIHKTVHIGVNVKIGKGNYIGAYTIIGPDVIIGDYNMIQSFTVVGHDARIGSWNRIDTHVTCVGGVQVMDETTIHTAAVINHGVVVEPNAHVGACSFVIKRVKSGTTVCGNPAKKLL